MKHFFKQHRLPIGIWVASAFLLILSSIWLKELDRQGSGLHEIIAEAPKTVGLADEEALTAEEKKETLRSAPTISKSRLPAPLEKKETTVAEKTSPPTNVVYPQPALKNEEQPELIEITFQFNGLDWSKELKVKTPPGATVYEAMAQMNSQNQIVAVFKNFSGLGAFVESIDGTPNSVKGNKFWIYYVNNKAAPVGISSFKLSNNDSIIWNYESPKF